MPGVDWIPGVSHLKAAVQLVTGNSEGAEKTMENFCRECPVVSQVTSLVQLAAGDSEGAVETQKRCLGTINNVANGIPVVGHAKGLVHRIVGDSEGCNQALDAANRSTVVLASGTAAGLATGGFGAAAAAITAGYAYDSIANITTGKRQGLVAAIESVIKNPSVGTIFDAAFIPVSDGLAGNFITGKTSTQITLTALGVTAKLKQMEQLTRNDKNKSLRQKKIYPETYDQQENALLSDSYIGAAFHTQARLIKTDQLNQRKQQAPRGSLSRSYKNMPFVSPEQFRRNSRPNQNKSDRTISRYAWLHVHMPTEFNYTGVIQVNNEIQGLLHSVLRHFDQWLNYIPDFRTSFGNIPKVIRDRLNRIKMATSEDSVKAALSDSVANLPVGERSKCCGRTKLRGAIISQNFTILQKKIIHI